MADIVIPNVFVPHTLIESAKVNEDFNALAAGALNKLSETEETVEGPVTFEAPVTFEDDVTIEGDLDVDGTITGSFTMNGSGLTNLNASELTSGTVPLDRISGLTIDNWSNDPVTDRNVSIWTNDAGYLTSATSGGTPIGAIMMWGGAVAPATWRLCDGAEYAIADYAALYAVVGDAYNTTGNGSTTFNVPDLQQRFPLGLSPSGTGDALGETGGDIDHVHAQAVHAHSIGSHTHTYDQVITHTHPITEPNEGAGHLHSISEAAPGGQLDEGTDDTKDYMASGSFDTDYATTDITVDAPVGAVATGTTAGSSGNTGNSAAADTAAANPPYLVVNFIIRAVEAEP